MPKQPQHLGSSANQGTSLGPQLLLGKQNRREASGQGLRATNSPELPVGWRGLGDDRGWGRQRGVQGVVAQVQGQRSGAHDGWCWRGNDHRLGSDLLKVANR